MRPIKKNMPSILFACVLLLLPGFTSAQKGTEDAAAVVAATSEWISAFNTRDPDRIAALYAPDAILWGTVSKTIRTTHQEILEYFTESATKRPNLRMFLGEY